MNLGALAARYTRAYNDRDFDTLRELFDEDVELVVDGMSFRGVDAAVAYGVASVSRFPGLYIGSERLIADSGDTIVTEVQLVNGDPASGHSRPQGRSCMIWRGRDGRIVSCHGYYMADPAEGAGAVVVPSRAEAAVVAEEQTALRRVATLVARGVSQDELFAAVTQEIGWLVGADPTALVRFEPDDTVNLVAAWSARQADFPIGSSCPVDEELRSMRETGRPWRWGPADLPLTGTFVEEARALGIRTAVGVPIVVDGRVWGFAFASSIADKPFADNAAARLANFTELVATAISNAQARAEVQRLADEQAALRRVATLVAHESPAEEVFAAVAEEIARLLPVEYAGMGRYEADYTVTYLAVWGRSVESVPPGRLTLGGKNLATIVLDTGRPARIDDYADASGLLGVNARETGTRSAVATPILVEGRLWGVMGAGSTLEQPLPPDAEARLASFTELVATAIANAESRADLAASRARIVAAADETRRRIERDLHDGAQQRLVHTVIVQELALRALKNGDATAGELMVEALHHAQQANAELTELAHGGADARRRSPDRGSDRERADCVYRHAARGLARPRSTGV
jgi:GAF domain-containing protein